MVNTIADVTPAQKLIGFQMTKGWPRLGRSQAMKARQQTPRIFLFTALSSALCLWSLSMPQKGLAQGGSALNLSESCLAQGVDENALKAAGEALNVDSLPPSGSAGAEQKFNVVIQKSAGEAGHSLTFNHFRAGQARRVWGSNFFKLAEGEQARKLCYVMSVEEKNAFCPAGGVRINVKQAIYKADKSLVERSMEFFPCFDAMDALK